MGEHKACLGPKPLATYLLVDSHVNIGNGLFQDGRQSDRHGGVGKGVLLRKDKPKNQRSGSRSFLKAISNHLHGILGKL